MNSHLKTTWECPRPNRLAALFLLLACMLGLELSAYAAATTTFEATSATIIGESCLPANGALDPGETNIVTFVLKNISGGGKSNVKISLVADAPGGVTFVSGQQAVGDIAKDGQATATFTFVTTRGRGQSVTPSLRITSGSNDTPTQEGDLTFGDNKFSPPGSNIIGAVTDNSHPFSNAASIAIRDLNDNSDLTAAGLPTKAAPYPSKITVSGIPTASDGSLTGFDLLQYKLGIRLNNLSHSFTPDMDVLLVPPGSAPRAVKLMSDAGFGPASNVTLTFQNGSTTLPPEASGIPITSGTYGPSDFGPLTGAGSDTFPDLPSGTTLDSNGNGTGTPWTLADILSTPGFNPNGDWLLFIVDDNPANNGVLAGGWTIDVVTTTRTTCLSGYPTIAADNLGNPLSNLTGDNSLNEQAGDGSQTPVTRNFFVNSVQFAASDLTVQAFSSDVNIVPTDNDLAGGGIILGGSGNDRTIQFKNTPDGAGLVTLTLQVTAPNGLVSSQQFQVNYNPVNDAPTVTPPGNQAQNVGVATTPLPFTIGDAETDPNLLIVTAQAVLGATSLVPNSNIFLGGSGPNRTIQIQPANDTPGEVTIHITVTDPQGLHNPASPDSGDFKVAFNVPSGSPTINPINNTAIDEDTTKTIPIFVSDQETAAQDLVVTVTSTANPSDLLTSLSVSGTGGTRTLTIVPKQDKAGSASITVKVRDGNGNERPASFTLTVNPVNDPPVISTISPITINEDTDTGDIGFTVTDIPGDPSVTGSVATEGGTPTLAAKTSSNSLLVPISNIVVTDGAGNAKTVKITPAANLFGTTIIGLKYTDNGSPAKTTTASFQVTVTPVNDAPAVGGVFDNSAGTLPAPGGVPTPWTEANAKHLNEDTTTSVFLTGINPGPNETGQSMTVNATSSNASIPVEVVYTSPNPFAEIKLKPVANANGDTTVTVTVTDNGGTANGGSNSTSTKFKVTVDPVNDAPTVSDVALQFAGLGETITVGVAVGDLESAPTALTLNASEVLSGAAKITQIQTTGAGPSRFITVVTTTTASAGTSQDAVIQYSVTDDGTPPLTSTVKTFTVRISNSPPNHNPVISPIAPNTVPVPDTSTDEDNIITTADFNVTDPLDDPTESNLNSLVVTATSDTQALISDVNIVPSGSGKVRHLIIVPNKDAFGTAKITVTVTDAGQAGGFNKRSASTTFKAVINPVEDIPIIILDGSAAITLAEDTASKNSDNGGSNSLGLGKIQFTASDAETTPTNLTFSISSTDETVVPKGNVVISDPLGTGGILRTLTITGAANKSSGTSTVTVRVLDQTGLSAAFTIAVTLTAVNDAPTLDPITAGPFQQVTADTTRSITLTNVTPGGGSDENGQTLTFSVTSDNTALIPNPSLPAAPDANHKTTLQLTQKAGKFGSAKITVQVTDDGTAGGAAKTTKQEFVVTVGQVNVVPTISAFTDLAIGEGSSTGIIGFTVNDAETPAGALIVNASSNNDTLLPPGSVVLGGTGTDRSIRITPPSNQFGTATITVSVTDLGNASGTDVRTASRTFVLTVNLVQQKPVISAIADFSTTLNQESDIVSFTVSDQETAAANISVAAVSTSRADIIPLGNVQFGGSGSTRLMIVIPAKDQFGEVTLGIQATDADSPTPNVSLVRTFKVKVIKPNNPPTITSIANLTINQGTTTGPIAATVGDPETASGFLALSATSTNPTLVPVANITFGGSKTSRTVTITPVATESGSSVITVTVTDLDGGTASTTFTLKVLGVSNDPPTISTIADVITQKNKPTSVISFTVDDKETAKGFLVVTAQSSNQLLIPVGNIFFGGSAGSRTVFITPGVDQTGTATITLTVTDGGGKTASSSFKITVTAPPVQAKNDFNGDGKPDILFQDANAFIAFWSMDKENLLTSGLFSPNNSGSPDWRIVGSGNFNGDNKPDLLFQHTNGDLAVWYMNGISLTSPTLLEPSNPGAGWRAIGTGDFNGDGKSDILLQKDDRTLAVWYMNGVSLTSPTLVSPSNPGAEWAAVAVGDFNSDGNPDIVFEDNQGTLAAWYLNGVDLSSGTLISPPGGDPAWRVVSALDLDGDSNTDLIFQNTNGAVGAWFMNGVDLIRATLLNPASPGGTWQVVGP